ncbi:MAG TPA: ATP-binding cassette domain-containing protein, partial [Dehalococcoidia bacterium]|nr:ATP-binding cassette domain-containing protein [Dehalococcoidia bacterium]
GGEQQRVAIARAIANRPSLILADEPTGELDSSTAFSIFRLLREVARVEGITIITSTHDRMVMEMAGRVEELADGRLLSKESQRLFAYATQRGTDHFRAPASPPPEQHAQPAAADEPPAAVPIAAEADTADDVQRWAPAARSLPLATSAEAPLRREPEQPPPAEEISRWAPPERRG